MPITEQIDTRKYSRDANGQRAGVRVFQVVGVPNEEAARLAWEEFPGGRQFPTDPALVFDRVDIQGTNGNAVYVVTASYSTFRGGRRPTDPETLPVVPFFGWEYAKETVEIPFAFQRTITTGTDDDSVTAVVWDAKTVKVAERRVRRSVRVEYTSGNTQSLDIIAEQDRKVHTIGGKRYLFLGANVNQNQTDQTKFIITYTWELDRGTSVMPTESTLIAFPDAPIPDPGTGQQYGYLCAPRRAPQLPSGAVVLRLPYTVMDLVANQDATKIPEAVLIQPYEEDVDGWRLLPGMVPL